MLGWFDPTAFILPLVLLNATHFMWINGSETLYFYQASISFAPSSEAEAQGAYAYLASLCRLSAVKPVEEIAKGVYETEIWCSPDGVRWAWLRWLPLRLSAYNGTVEVREVNGTVYTAIGVFKSRAPAGWYNNGTAVAQLGRIEPPRPRVADEDQTLREEIEKLKAELESAKKAAADAETKAERAEKLADLHMSMYMSCQSALSQERASVAAEAAELKKRLEATESELTSVRQELDAVRASLEAESAGAGLAGAIASIAVSVLSRRRES